MSLFALCRPLLACLSPEAAHRATLAGLRLGLGPRLASPPSASLGFRLWDRDFVSPLGLAAGFDKDAVAIAPLLAMGFAFVEVGTITPKPQPGNPKPRIFRLKEDRAVINRLGFNNRGMEGAARRLAAFRRRAAARGGLVGVNIGRNKDQTDAEADYAVLARRLGSFADYLVINVSSPNTPGLRALQDRESLIPLLAAVRRGLAESGAGARGLPPVLVKIAPDLDDEALADIAALARDGAMDGLIVSNTTIGRPPGLASRYRRESGGLSGRPLFAPSTRVLSDCYRETGGAVPLIGIGGISSAEDAWAKIRAGASLISVYTGLVYRGPGLVQEILDGLAARLAAEGMTTIAEAVGSDHR